MFSILSGCVFFAGLVAYALTLRTSIKGGNVPKSTIAWNVPYGLLLLVLSVFGFAGLIDDTSLCLGASAVAAAIILCTSQVGIRRERLIERLSSLPNRRRLICEYGILVLFSACSVLTIETPYSHVIPLGGPSFWWLELLLILLVAAASYHLGRRRGVALMPEHVFLAFVGIAQYFIRRFKNAAILPSDLMAIGTAMSVGGQYTYSLDCHAILGIAVSSLAILVASMLTPRWTQAEGQGVPSDNGDDTEHKNLPKRGLVRDALIGVACAAACVALVVVPNYMEAFHVEIMYWYSISYYENQGFLPTFIAIWQDMPIREPEGYSDKAAKKVLGEMVEEYDETVGQSEDRQAAEAQFDAEQPSVIAVMNESFSDLSEFDGLRSGYKGPQFFKGMDDTLYRGKLFVNVHGGGTCNSEFEFLTGNSLGYMGAGKYPYSSFWMGNIDNLAKQFSALGYHTTAMHPNWASNWNRNRIYPQFGFDEFLDMDAFGGFPEKDLITGETKMETPTGEPIFHSGVSDQATYEKILEILDSSSDPQFVFDVTMQNHGSYNQKNIPEDKLTNYVPSDTYEDPLFTETPERLNEYLSCVEESDRALKWFVSELKKLDRPVVLVFFGDHQPSMTPDYNDAWYVDEDEMTHAQRIYHANYVVWANYDVEGASQKGKKKDISIDVLATTTLNSIGAPLSDYQKAQVVTGREILATNLHGYMGSDGQWHDPESDSEYSEAYGRMALIEHLNFARKLS